jgi:selenocysteine lyase/cysteine desulfurase
MDWNTIRDQFPATKKYIYLNAAGGSPVSVLAANAARQFYDEMEQEGDTLYEHWMNKTERVRERVAAFIHADPEEIAFTMNTSHGMNLVASIYSPQEGTVLTMEDEFPSSTLPWINKGYTVTFVESDKYTYPIEHIENHITPQTKFLVSSLVQYSTGFKQNARALGDLCKKHDLIFVLNVTQAIGVIPIDVREYNVDYLMFTGLKWPMAGYGTGVFYINKKMLRHINMPVAGWQSVHYPENMNNTELDLEYSGRAFEMGCPPFATIFALGAAFELLNSIGKQTIYERIMYLSRYFEAAIEQIGFTILSPQKADTSRSGITLIKHHEPDKTVEKLAQEGIIVSKRGSGIRVAFHIYNTEEDIDRLVQALKQTT